MRSALYEIFKAHSKKMLKVILTISLVFLKLFYLKSSFIIYLYFRLQESILFEQLFLFDQLFKLYFDLVFKIRYFNIQLSVIWYLIQILSAFTSWLNWDLNTTKIVVKILVKFILALGLTRLMGLISKLVYYKTQTTMMAPRVEKIFSTLCAN